MEDILKIAAAAGSPSGAVARQLATMLFSDILITLINRLLLPLVYTYIAACVAYAAVGNEGLKRIAGTLKWVVTSILTVVLLVFVGYLTVSGVIAGSTDAVMAANLPCPAWAGGRRYPVRRGGNRIGRAGIQKTRGGVRHACGVVRGALPPARIYYLT
ncbi:MAG: stage III sporulation protein AE [Flavonifractor plautii]